MADLLGGDLLSYLGKVRRYTNDLGPKSTGGHSLLLSSKAAMASPESDLWSLLSQMQAYSQPTPEEQAAARRQQLAIMFASLVGAPKGMEWDRLGQGSLLGMQARGQALSGASENRRKAMQDAAAALQLQNALQGQQAQKTYAQALSSMPAQGVQQSSPMQAAMAQAPSLAPTNANVGAVQRVAQAMPAGTPAGAQSDIYARLMAQADYLEAQARKPENGIAAVTLMANAQKLREEALKFRPEFGGLETIGGGPGGLPQVVQLMKNEPPRPTQFAPKPDMRVINQGDRQAIIDLMSAQPGTTLPTYQSPDSRASVGATYAGQRETARHNLQTEAALAASAGVGKWVTDIPSGIQVNTATGESRPITTPAGTPLPPKGSEQKAISQRNQLEMANRVLGMVDNVLGKIGATTTGPLGAALGQVPGSAAYDLRAQATSIRSNLGLEQLAALRAASPTGGALGQVSNMENTLLETTVANLDPNQSPAQLREQLKQVQEHLKNVRDLIHSDAHPLFGDLIQSSSQLPANRAPTLDEMEREARRRGLQVPR